MNQDNHESPSPDGFEQRLRRRPVKKLPAAWREEILLAAQHAAPARPAHERSRHVSRFTFHGLLRQIFWSHSKGWTVLAAAWVVILGLHFSSRESEPVLAARQAAQPTREMRQALKQQELLLAELIGQPASPDITPAKPAPSRPHSRRREEIQVV